MEFDRNDVVPSEDDQNEHEQSEAKWWFSSSFFERPEQSIGEGHLNEAKDKRSDNFKMNKKMNEKAGLKRILKRSKHVTYVTVRTISTITISLVIKQNWVNSLFLTFLSNIIN